LQLGLLRPAPAPLWAGEWDAIIITPRLRESCMDDILFGLHQIMLPQNPQGWSTVIERPRRSGISRLLQQPRPDPDRVPYGRRKMPRLGAIGLPQPMQILGLTVDSIDQDDASLRRFLAGIHDE
jgi:hypothetical protein